MNVLKQLYMSTSISRYFQGVNYRFFILFRPFLSFFPVMNTCHWSSICWPTNSWSVSKTKSSFSFKDSFLLKTRIHRENIDPQLKAYMYRYSMFKFLLSSLLFKRRHFANFGTRVSPGRWWTFWPERAEVPLEDRMTEARRPSPPTQCNEKVKWKES
jgi:hypothetical protein